MVLVFRLGSSTCRIPQLWVMVSMMSRGLKILIRGRIQAREFVELVCFLMKRLNVSCFFLVFFFWFEVLLL